MCKILDGFVAVHVGIGGGQKTKQDKETTQQIRATSGDRYKKATDALYPTEPFAAIQEPMRAFKKLVDLKTLCSTMKAVGLVPVKSINEIRNEYAKTLTVIGPAKADIAANHDKIVAEQIAARGGRCKPDDYPAVFPLDDWFYLELQWLAHPKESPLSSAMAERESVICEDLKSEMAKQYDGYIAAARDDLMGRVKTAMGEFGRKCQRLRTDTCECQKCHYQWVACMGTTCPRCQTADAKVSDQQKKVYSSQFEAVKELADTLGVMLPDDLVGAEKIREIMAPVLNVTEEQVRVAVEREDHSKLEDYEDTARKVAGDLASIIADTFV